MTWRAPRDRGTLRDVQQFNFTIFVEGVDLLSADSQDALHRLDFEVDVQGVDPDDEEALEAHADRVSEALRHRGGTFFESMMFSVKGDEQFAACTVEATSLDVAAQWAVSMLTYALPGVRVVSIEQGRRGAVDIR